jgi:IS5 family transposase
LRQVNVDTTVKEKAIAFPTDARLYHKARCVLVREAKRVGIELRQSYRRVGKRALQKQGRYAHAQQLKRAGRETRRLRTYLGRVIRDLQRKATSRGLELDQQLSSYLERATCIYEQQRTDKHKLYSMQAPEVECLAKGKEHKKYEFGCKVSVVTTSQRGWVVGLAALQGNPYDGHTLKAAYAQVAKLTGVTPVEIFVEKGYRGSQHHPANGGLPRGQKTEWPAETLTAAPLGHRAGDWALETRPPAETKLSARQKRRLHQCPVGGLRL